MTEITDPYGQTAYTFKDGAWHGTNGTNTPTQCTRQLKLKVGSRYASVFDKYLKDERSDDEESRCD